MLALRGGGDSDLYLADSEPRFKQVRDVKMFHDANILMSFYYAGEFTENILIPNAKRFLLDSGAYSFLAGKEGVNMDWDGYVARYAAFIKKNKVRQYFELDIDPIIGYPEVRRIRDRLEAETGVTPIPVWHVSRGIQEYREMCSSYPYVAIGGIVTKEIPPDKYRAFPAMIREAHDRGAKVHGLGFTRISDLPKYHFDSVDSTAWTAGNRFGFLYEFRNNTIVKYHPPEGCRMTNVRALSHHNFSEWVKYAKYAEVKL